MFFFGFLNNFVYLKKKLRILVNGQAMATWPDVLKIAKMAKNSHLWTHWTRQRLRHERSAKELRHLLRHLTEC